MQHPISREHLAAEELTVTLLVIACLVVAVLVVATLVKPFFVQAKLIEAIPDAASSMSHSTRVIVYIKIIATLPALLSCGAVRATRY